MLIKLLSGRMLVWQCAGAVFFAAACQAQTTAVPQQPVSSPAAAPASVAAPTPSTPAFAAGTLLTKEEVGEVQGCKMTGAQDSSGKLNQFLLSQCFYSSSEPNKSVSLGVTRTDPDAVPKRTAKAFWHETFDRYADLDDAAEEKERAKEKERPAGKPMPAPTHPIPPAPAGKPAATATPAATPRGGEEEEGEGKNPPRRIDGLGDAAFWTNNPVGGVLYVLKGEVFIRLSVGGPDKPEIKLAKSKALAEKVLPRL